MTVEPRYLFDTNVLIYLVAALSDSLRVRVENLAPGEAVTSAICVAEAAVGIRGTLPEQRRAFEHVYLIAEPQPFDRVAAEYFGRLPFRRGKSDRLIAAHALALNLTLVTNNERDFADIPDLRVENWTR